VTLNGKVAMVTGSTSGIGRASALALAARGAHVLVVGRDAQRGAGVVEEITEKGGGAEFHQTTLSDVESARHLAAWATETSGSHVDILVNNVGTAVVGPTASATEAEFDETFSLNVKVPFFLVAALAPAMAERGWGSIVNMSTMVAGFGQPGMAIYGASRAALELLTKSWAAEFGPRGVRVNAVAPGPVRTPLTAGMGDMPDQMAALAPAARVATPEEIGDVIAFLASDEASFVHGVTVAVDGGRRAT
jgi:NAD(P)-dependent dehydrogenase (short-subunit alcohol dehydrogenase family)